MGNEPSREETLIISRFGIPWAAHLFRILGADIGGKVRHWRSQYDTKPGATAQTIYFMSFPRVDHRLPF